MKEVWYFLYRDYESDKIYSSTYYYTFDNAWESLERMQNDYSSTMPISPVMKGYVKDTLF